MMKKSILNIGKALNKAEQQSINGGVIGCPHNCEIYANQQACELRENCLWGDWTWEGTGVLSCGCTQGPL